MKTMLLALLAATVMQAADGSRDLRLLEAVKRRDMKAFETLLAQGIDINSSAPDGATSLAWAAFLDLSSMAEKLIAAGAKIHTTGEYGETPLTLTLANGNVSLAEKL